VENFQVPLNIPLEIECGAVIWSSGTLPHRKWSVTLELIHSLGNASLRSRFSLASKLTFRTTVTSRIYVGLCNTCSSIPYIISALKGEEEGEKDNRRLKEVTYEVKKWGKTIPMLNLAPHHEDVWGSGCIAPRFLHLNARWRQMVNFTPLPRSLRENGPWYPMWRRDKSSHSVVAKSPTE
jgi:hypothetical protein